MKNTIKIILSLLILIILHNSCKDSTAFNGEGNEVVSQNEHLVMATVFHQKAAEMRALSYQAYNIARMMLDNDLRRAGLSKKQAIVVDIDETVLDNSPFQAKCIIDETNYPTNWKEWCELEKAKPLPGAVDFLNYAKSKGVEVFYITNRKEMFREVTMNNLIKNNFPFVDEKHLLMRNETSGKKGRRDIISKDYRIVLLIGDNLNDFSEVFEKKSVNERFNMTDSLKNEIGRRFIVLPNVMYGEWEEAIYNYNNTLTDKDKKQLRYKSLASF